MLNQRGRGWVSIFFPLLPSRFRAHAAGAYSGFPGIKQSYFWHFVRMPPRVPVPLPTPTSSLGFPPWLECGARGAMGQLPSPPNRLHSRSLFPTLQRGNTTAPLDQGTGTYTHLHSQIEICALPKSKAQSLRPTLESGALDSESNLCDDTFFRWDSIFG